MALNTKKFCYLQLRCYGGIVYLLCSALSWLNELTGMLVHYKQKIFSLGLLTNTFSVLCQLGASYVSVTTWPTCNISNCLTIPVSIGFTALTKAPVPVGSPVTYNCSAAGRKISSSQLLNSW